MAKGEAQAVQVNKFSSNITFPKAVAQHYSRHGQKKKPEITCNVHGNKKQKCFTTNNIAALSQDVKPVYKEKVHVHSANIKCAQQKTSAELVLLALIFNP